MILALSLVIVAVFLVGSVTLGVLACVYWFFKHWLWWVVLACIIFLLGH